MSRNSTAEFVLKFRLVFLAIEMNTFKNVFMWFLATEILPFPPVFFFSLLSIASGGNLGFDPTNPRNPRIPWNLINLIPIDNHGTIAVNVMICTNLPIHQKLTASMFLGKPPLMHKLFKFLRSNFDNLTDGLRSI